MGEKMDGKKMDEKQLESLLASGKMTREDVLAVLVWQLSLPAEKTDAALIDECDRLLGGDAPGLSPERSEALLGSLLARIDTGDTAVPELPELQHTPNDAPAHRKQSSRRTQHTRRTRPVRRALILALLLLLALAVGAAAYGYRRGVLNFTEDFGFGEMVAQEGAEEFVVSGPLAHVELEHVTVDVLEAVCDGTELRVVYGLTPRDGEWRPAAHAEGFEMPGAAEGEVTMCDFIRVNGQEAYFYDTWQAAGEAPGQVLYYLQANLLSYGVDVSGEETLNVGLPIYPFAPGTYEHGYLEFTMPANIPPERLREAELIEADFGGHPATLTGAVFSPLSGYAEFAVEGLTREEFAKKLSSFTGVYAADGSLLTDSHATAARFTEDGAVIGIAMTPPRGEWPETLIVAFELTDYSPDWEAELRLRAPE